MVDFWGLEGAIAGVPMGAGVRGGKLIFLLLVGLGVGLWLRGLRGGGGVGEGQRDRWCPFVALHLRVVVYDRLMGDGISK